MPELSTRVEKENIAVVLNPAAGRGTDISALVRAHRPDARILIAHDAGQVQPHTAAALRDGATLVVAAGGDGTIRTVAQELAGTEAVLGVLPFGTRNHFAQDVGIPLDPEQVFRSFLTGTIRNIDVGFINGRAFLLYAALGLYPAFVRERERYETRGSRHGLWAFARAVWTTLRRYPMLHLEVIAGERRAEHESPFVFVANNIAMREHLPIGVITRPQMGELAVYVAHQMQRRELLHLLLRLSLRSVTEPADLSFACADRMRIESRRKRLWVATDGEVVRMQPPLDISLQRGALRVLVPDAASPA